MLLGAGLDVAGGDELLDAWLEAEGGGALLGAGSLDAADGAALLEAGSRSGFSIKNCVTRRLL